GGGLGRVVRQRWEGSRGGGRGPHRRRRRDSMRAGGPTSCHAGHPGEGVHDVAADLGKKYVIIGNGIAGTTAAAELRKGDESCAIWLITNEPYPLYNRVSLPRFLQGLLPEQKVMIRDLEWHHQQRIHLLTETTVVRIDAADRAVYLDRGGPLRYDALLVATGGWANPLTVPGVPGTNRVYNFVT